MRGGGASDFINGKEADQPAPVVVIGAAGNVLMSDYSFYVQAFAQYGDRRSGSQLSCEGMLDVSVAGEIFAAPGAPRCLEALRLADGGAGVVFIVLNDSGDILSSNVTLQLAERNEGNQFVPG
jgi:Dak1 domain-containing protein